MGLNCVGPFIPVFFSQVNTTLFHSSGAVCLVTQLCLTLCDPIDYSQQGSSVHGILHGDYWSGYPFASLGIFLNQGSNPSLLHCRWILYHLNHQGSTPMALSCLNSQIQMFRFRGTTITRADYKLYVDFWLWGGLSPWTLEVVQGSTIVCLCVVVWSHHNGVIKVIIHHLRLFASVNLPLEAVIQLNVFI